MPEKKKFSLTQDDLAYIDELSGLTDFTEHMIIEKNMPLAAQRRLRAHIAPYTGTKSKEQVAYEVHEKFFGR